jgi:hypothetical protein
MLASRKVVSSNPDEVIEFVFNLPNPYSPIEFVFNLPNPYIRTMALGFT